MGALSGSLGSQCENLLFGGLGLKPLCGSGWANFGTVKTRRLGFADDLIASGPPPREQPARLISIFDCPEHTHTSPTATSLKTMAFGPFFLPFGAGFFSSPRMVKTPSVPAGNAASLAIHLPSLSALTAWPSSRLPSGVLITRWT